MKNFIKENLDLSFSFNEMDESAPETVFKRHFSLPYQQCRQNPMITKRFLREQQSSGKRCELNLNSSRMDSLAYSSSRKIMKKYGYSPSKSNASPQAQTLSKCVDGNSINECSKKLKIFERSQFQYQKNSLRKISTSNENIPNMRKAYERSGDLAKIVKLSSNSHLLANSNKSSETINPTFKRIKKQPSYSCGEKATFLKEATLPNRSSVCLTTCCNALKMVNPQISLHEKNFVSSNLKRNSFVYFYPKNNFDFDDLNNDNFLNLTDSVGKQRAPPRLSDSHLLFKLNRQKVAQNAKMLSNNSNMNLMKSCGNEFVSQKSFLIETQV